MTAWNPRAPSAVARHDPARTGPARRHVVPATVRSRVQAPAQGHPTVVTTYEWAELATGTLALPGPAVVTSPWVLELRAENPADLGFRLVLHPGQWPQVRAARGMVADFRKPGELLVVHAERTWEIDADALLDRRPDAQRAGGVHWCIGSIFRGPDVQAFHEQVHREGRLLLLTGDLTTYWSTTRDGPAAGFAGLFPTGTWAAWVPLCTHLYADGVGTHPTP